MIGVAKAVMFLLQPEEAVCVVCGWSREAPAPATRSRASSVWLEQGDSCSSHKK